MTREKNLPTVDEEQSSTESNSSILVVDDNDMGRMTMPRVLSMSPWHNSNIEVCASVRSAIQTITAGFTPDFILSEMVMPGESGFDLYSWIEENKPELLDTLGFTACGDGEGRQMIDFMSRMRTKKRLIEKPFLPEEIISMMQEISADKMII